MLPRPPRPLAMSKIRDLPKVSIPRWRIDLAITGFALKCPDQKDASNELLYAGLNRYSQLTPVAYRSDIQILRPQILDGDSAVT
jgi:hypothetical protein